MGELSSCIQTVANVLIMSHVHEHVHGQDNGI